MKRKRTKTDIGHYAMEIVRITGCSKREAVVVEEIMRNHIFHSTLDWQTPEQYRAAALEGYKALTEMRDAGQLPGPYVRLLRGKEAFC